MRINQFVAQASKLSRRAADQAILDKRILVNGQVATLGLRVSSTDKVELDNQQIKLPQIAQTIIMNKPRGYVVSRNGQGSHTVYELLPPELDNLKAVGRLDKDSSGVLVFTSDGILANELLHPKFVKEKKYEVKLDKALTKEDREHVERGIMLDDGLSALRLSGEDKNWSITMHEGRNRQIRRTFEKLGYKVIILHRTAFGSYEIGNIPSGNWQFAQKTGII